MDPAVEIDLLNQLATTEFKCRHYTSALMRLEILIKLSASYYTEQSPEILRLLALQARFQIKLFLLNDAKKNFKRFNKLKNEIKYLIPFEILEENRLNKALFFFSKRKLVHCKEAIRDFQSSENHTLFD